MAYITHEVKKELSEAGNLAWEFLEKLIKLAAAAQIPICGSAFGVAKELIDMFNARAYDFYKAVDDNKKACKQLLRVTAQYGQAIVEFAEALEALTPGYLKVSQDQQAEIARTAIQKFSFELGEVKRIVRKQTANGKVAQLLRCLELRDEVKECKDRLTAAHQAFTDYKIDILIANTHETRATILHAQGALGHQDEFQIIGAVRDIPHPNPGRRDLKVKDRKCTAKLYRNHEDRFLRDMEWLAQLQRFNFPRVFGHHRNFKTSFIVFYEATLTPVSDCPEDFFRKHRPDGDSCNCQLWKMLSDIKDAALFLDARVDDVRNIIIAPPSLASMEESGEAAGSLDEGCITDIQGFGFAIRGRSFLFSWMYEDDTLHDGQLHRQPISQNVEALVTSLRGVYHQSTYRFPAQGVLQFRTEHASSTSVAIFDLGAFVAYESFIDTEAFDRVVEGEGSSISESSFVVKSLADADETTTDMAAYKGVFATGDRAVTMPSPLTATMPVYPDHDTFGAGVLLYRGDLARRITSYYRRRDGQASGCYLDELPQTLTKQIDDVIQNLSPSS